MAAPSSVGDLPRRGTFFIHRRHTVPKRRQEMMR